MGSVIRGGKVRSGETPEANIVREMQEETGLRGTPVREVVFLQREFAGTPYHLTDFLLGEEGGILRPGKGVEEMRWVAEDGWPLLPLAGGMEELRSLRWESVRDAGGWAASESVPREESR